MPHTGHRHARSHAPSETPKHEYCRGVGVCRVCVCESETTAQGRRSGSSVRVHVTCERDGFFPKSKENRKEPEPNSTLGIPWREPLISSSARCGRCSPPRRPRLWPRRRRSGTAAWPSAHAEGDAAARLPSPALSPRMQAAAAIPNPVCLRARGRSRARW